MQSFFTPEFFIKNRQRLRDLSDSLGPIVVTANGLLQRNGDGAYNFRQDSNFWYLTGIDTPDAILVLDKNTEYIILPILSPVDEVLGAPPDAEEIIKRSGIDKILPEAEGWQLLTKSLKNTQQAATFSATPVYSKHYGFYTNPARRMLIKRIRSIHADIELLDLRKQLMQMRMIKQTPELMAIQKAVDITVDTLKNIEKSIHNYSFEYEIEAELSYGFRKNGALGHAFSPIVAGGENTCHIHYMKNSATLKGAQHLYIDTGAEVENYSADITRTYIMDESATRHRKILNAVEEVALYARKNLKPGITIRENEQSVELFMGGKLKELGLIKTISHETVRKYYTHSCSHYLGLDTHDSGDYDAPLEENMVLTVEPGIYIPEEGIGVRVEDDVLITKSGIKVLSEKLYT